LIYIIKDYTQPNLIHLKRFKNPALIIQIKMLYWGSKTHLTEKRCMLVRTVMNI